MLACAAQIPVTGAPSCSGAAGSTGWMIAGACFHGGGRAVCSGGQRLGAAGTHTAAHTHAPTQGKPHKPPKQEPSARNRNTQRNLPICESLPVPSAIQQQGVVWEAARAGRDGTKCSDFERAPTTISLLTLVDPAGGARAGVVACVCEARLAPVFRRNRGVWH